MSIMKKLLLGFSSIILLLAIITAITYVQFYSVNKSYSETIDDRTEKTKFATYAIFETYKEQNSLRDYLIVGNEEALNTYNFAREEFRKNIENLRVITVDTEGFEVIDKMITAEEEYHQVAQKVMKLKQQDNTEGYIRVMKEEGTSAIANIEAAAKELLFFQQDKFKATSKELSKQTFATINTILVLSILAILIGVSVAILLSRSFSRNIQLISNSAKEIADGNLAIEKMNVKSRDEVGQLAQSFNEMSKNLRTVIWKVSETSEQVAASAEELLASAEETTAATNQVATHITEVANHVENQDRSTEESVQGINQITTGIVQVAENASAVAKVSIETRKQANSGYEHIQDVVKQMNIISNANFETNEVIQALERRSAEIGKIIEVITSIADQTNLLALNAAIESARAGEHGKGFAVVADEVRKLAEQSRQSASQIAEIIQFIQIDTLKAAQLMNNGNKEVQNGLNLAEETGKTFNVILKSIEQSNSQTEELSAISEEMSARAQEVNAVIEEVSTLAKASSASAGEIAVVTEEQLAATEEVSSAASSLANMAEELRELVKKFKI